MTDYELYHHGGHHPGVQKAAKIGKSTGKKVSKFTSKQAKKFGKFAGKQAAKGKKAAIKKIKDSYKDYKEKKYYEKLHKKKISQMTDKELKDLTNRVKQEASLKDAKYEYRVQNARKFYKNVAEKPLNSFATTYGTNLAKSMFPELNQQKKKNQNKDDNVSVDVAVV